MVFQTSSIFQIYNIESKFKPYIYNSKGMYSNVHPRRNRIGTKSAELWAWGIEEISSMQGPLAVQEYIQQNIRNDPSEVKKIVDCPKEVDPVVWQYENARQFILELNLLVTTLKDVCTKQSCPTMKGEVSAFNKNGEIFLCTAHTAALQCSAFEYMIHNLDQSTTLLQNEKSYGNRVAISEIKHLQTIIRRLYRIFLHAYFHHRQLYQEFQKQMHLCKRFTQFSVKYDLLPAKLVGIPNTFTE